MGLKLHKNRFFFKYLPKNQQENHAETKNFSCNVVFFE